MKQNASREDKIYDVAQLHSIEVSQTQAMIEVLRVYFEEGISGKRIHTISDSAVASFLYKVEENLDKLESLVGEIVDHSREKPAKEIKFPQVEGIQ